MVRGKLENPFKCPPNMFKILIYGWRVEIGLNDFVQQVECVPAREGGGVGGRGVKGTSPNFTMYGKGLYYTRAFSGQIRIN